MIAILHRALKNAGDFLIFERGKKLVENILNESIVIGKAWKPLETALPRSVNLNNIDAIIIPGGPGIARNIESIYPFLNEALDYEIPVVFLGVGSYLFPGNIKTMHFKLDGKTVSILKKISDIYPIGVRDYYTKELLRFNGVTNVSMNGCPAWYELDMIDKPVSVRDEIEKIVFTPSSNPLFHSQSLFILKKLKEKFSDAQIMVSFHRGIEGHQKRIARIAKKLGLEIYDAHGSASKLQVYRDFDIHIGYRVHAHIYFLSIHKPSYLVIEDSRGLGAIHALGGHGIPAYSSLAEFIPTKISQTIYLASFRTLSIFPSISSILSPVFVRSPRSICTWLDFVLNSDFDSEFRSVREAVDTIRYHYHKRMFPFIKGIKKLLS